MPASSSAIADDARTVLPGRFRRWLLNALTVFLLYGNAIGVLESPRLRKVGVPAPAPLWLRDAFLMHGMFTSYSSRNVDFFIAGLRNDQGTSGDRGSWVPLALKEHFPERHGVTFTELFAVHQWDIYGPKAQRAAWRDLAARIRRRHNLLHPDRPIVRVRFGAIDWPQSPRGYRARKDEHARAGTWFEERVAR